MCASPLLRIDVEHIGRDHIRAWVKLALLETLHVVWHRREPDIDVEAILMATVVGDHRSAARLRYVADQEAVPADLFCAFRKSLDEANDLWIAPVAVARGPHDLPARSVDRQRHGTGKASHAALAQPLLGQSTSHSLRR